MQTIQIIKVKLLSIITNIVSNSQVNVALILTKMRNSNVNNTLNIDNNTDKAIESIVTENRLKEDTLKNSTN